MWPLFIVMRLHEKNGSKLWRMKNSGAIADIAMKMQIAGTSSAANGFNFANCTATKIQKPAKSKDPSAPTLGMEDGSSITSESGVLVMWDSVCGGTSLRSAPSEPG